MDLTFLCVLNLLTLGAQGELNTKLAFLLRNSFDAMDIFYLLLYYRYYFTSFWKTDLLCKHFGHSVKVLQRLHVLIFVLQAVFAIYTRLHVSPYKIVPVIH